jgi:putative endonuclease
MKKWIVYILELNDGSYYTGITNDLDKRLEAHKSGKGSKYVRSRLPFRVVYICYEQNRSGASKSEINIKKLSRKKKELLVEGSWHKNSDKIHLFCDQCGVVIVMERKDVDWPKFEIECLICKNTITHEEEQN